MGSVSIDPTVYLTPSKDLASYLQDKDLDSPPNNVVKVIKEEASVKLTVEDVKWIVKNIPDIPSSLLFSCQLSLPSPVLAERNPELEARCQKLRAEQEEREYKAMTGNVRRDGPGKEQEPFKKQMKEINSFLMLILQFVVSVACSFMFGFLGPYYLYGRTDLGPRLLFGIVCGFVVGCADMYFVIRHMLEEDGYTLSKKLD